MATIQVRNASGDVQTVNINDDPATGASQTAIATAVDTVKASVDATASAVAAVKASVDSMSAKVDRIGTRAYGAPTRVAVGGASALSATIAATEVMLHASVKMYVLAVAGTGTPTVSNTTGIPLEAGEKFHMRITSGQRIAHIRDTEDGFLHIVPVA